MMTLVNATTETSSENRNGACTVLYFEQPATEEEIKNALRHVAGSRSAYPDCFLLTDPDDEFFGYKRRETPVSTKAKLVRYECYGSC